MVGNPCFENVGSSTKNVSERFFIYIVAVKIETVKSAH